MKHIPMLFSTPMSAALQKGSKTQTRRIINPQPVIDEDSGYVYVQNHKHMLDIHNWHAELLEFEEYGLPQDVIWVRENCWVHNTWQKGVNDHLIVPGSNVFYDTDNLNTLNKEHYMRRSSMLMAKPLCRKFLEIEAISIQQLHDINDEDAIAEGILYNNDMLMYNYLLKMYCNISPIDSYKTLWQSINGKDSWNLNPWVYKITFKPVNKPANFLLKTNN